MWQSGGIAFITVAHNTWSRCFLKYNLKICEVKSSYLYSKFNCWINCRIAWKEIISSTSRLKAENKIKPLLRNQKKLFEEYRKNGCFQVTELNKLHETILPTCSFSDLSKDYLHTHLGILLKASLSLRCRKAIAILWTGDAV